MPLFEVQGPDGSTYEVDAPDERAALGAFQRTRGNFLPISWDAQGNVSFDSDAGIVGAFKRAFTLPGEVASGTVDPMSPEGRQRTLEMATVVSPTSAALRAGERAIPGVLKNLQKPKVKPPTAQALKDAAGAGYKAVRATGAEYPGTSVGGLADDVQRALETEGLIAELSPSTFTVLNKLRNPPEGSVVTISSLDAARKTLNRVAGDYKNPHDQEAARRVIERIDDFIQAGGQARPVAGTTPATPGGAADRPRLEGPAGPSPQEEAARLIQDARGNAAARFRSERITGIEDAAELRAAAANSGQNLGNALRQRLASLLLNKRETRGFTPKELASIRQVVEGTAATNALRYTGNLLGGGGGIGQTGIGAIGAGVGAAAGGWPGAVVGAAIPLAGAASRKGYNALAQKQVDQLDKNIRMRSPLYRKMVRAAPMEAKTPEGRAALLRLWLSDQLGGDAQ